MEAKVTSPSNTTRFSHQLRVVRLAIISRLLILTLLILFRSLAFPYDTSASINPDCLSQNANHTTRSDPILFPRVASRIESSVVWDGVYFVRISQCGYEYEQAYAFLPLLPLCSRALSISVFSPLTPLIGQRAVLALAGYVVNNIAFVFAALYLYRLSSLVLEDYDAAFQAATLFCFNPASIFYSSVYSESLYSVFSFGGIYYLLSGSNSMSVIMFALSGSARSNGVLNAGYFCFLALHQAYEALFQKNHIYMAVQRIALAATQTFCIFAPFVAFQAYGYFNICCGSSSNPLRPWCKATVPMLYDFLQSHYWNVGFLRYFQLKQLPNFVLASPILSLAVGSVIQYSILRPEIIFSLGFRAFSDEKESASALYSLATQQRVRSPRSQEKSCSKMFRENQTVRQRRRGTNGDISGASRNPVAPDPNIISPAKRGYSSILVLPFVLQLAFMAAVAFLVMHVQVATRFLSASPVIYWFISYLTVSPGKGRKWGQLVWLYFVAYILLGTLLFSNFYPFT